MQASRQIGEHQIGERHKDRMQKTSSLVSILLLALALSGSAGLPSISDPSVRLSAHGEALPPEPAYPWLYLRDGQALAPGEEPVVLLAVGDLMLGRDMASRSPVFAGVAAELRRADLALGNFEGAVPPPGIDPVDLPGDPAYEPYRLLVPAGAAKELREAGFDLLSLANNHALDAGESGLANTRAVLESAGITALGDPAGASTFAIRRVKGVRIAFLAFNRVPLPDFSERNVSQEQGDSQTSGADIRTDLAIQTIQDDIRLARAQADIVVVSLHWGVEYQLRPNPGQKELARAMLRAGADLVLGHHAHVVQAMEIVEAEGEGDPPRAQLIAYSLGNFAFDQGWDETGQGLALRVYLDERGLRAVQALPVWTSPRPHWMEPAGAGALLERAAPPPLRLGFACEAGACQPVSVPQADTSGLFWSGEIDLTGDGVAEVIRRGGQSVAIYQDGRQVWDSPPEWRVVDLALGDPDDDGRAELMLALYKAGPSGEETSHPFIVGYREGTYRLLWGGSAVSNPILELELGDVTGDGVQELVVLEESGTGGGRSLSVWDWHGWGFSLLWRSRSGIYQDLNLIPGEGGGIQTISVSTKG